MIFEETGFDIATIGKENPKRCLNSWRRVYNTRGVDRLKIETRVKHHKGSRPRTRGLTDTNKIKRMEI